MSHPAASNCNLDGNPLHEEQLEIVELVGGALSLNTVIDEERNLSMINFGEVIQSHGDAVQFVQGYCRVPVDRQFQTVITSAAGYPLDKTYYQTVKGMVGALGILKPGGDLFIASECEEGLGSPDYLTGQSKLIELGVQGFLDSINGQEHAEIDHWQTQMQTKAMMHGNIYLYSSLSADDRSQTGVQSVNNLQAAIEAAILRSEDNSVAIIPEGPYVIPYHAEPSAS